MEPNAGLLTPETVKIANGTARLLDIDAVVEPDGMNLVDECEGEYGTLTAEVSETIKLVAKTEGILLDPVYIGKAMARLIDMIKHGRFKMGCQPRFHPHWRNAGAVPILERFDVNHAV